MAAHNDAEADPRPYGPPPRCAVWGEGCRFGSLDSDSVPAVVGTVHRHGRMWHATCNMLRKSVINNETCVVWRCDRVRFPCRSCQIPIRP